MKAQKLSSLMLIALALVSCGKDKKDEQKNQIDEIRHTLANAYVFQHCGQMYYDSSIGSPILRDATGPLLLQATANYNVQNILSTMGMGGVYGNYNNGYNGYNTGYNNYGNNYGGYNTGYGYGNTAQQVRDTCVYGNQPAQPDPSRQGFRVFQVSEISVK